MKKYVLIFTLLALIILGFIQILFGLIGCGQTTVTTTPDSTTPTIIYVSPAAGATGVSTTAAVSAVFSKAMDDTTISTNTFTVYNTSIGLKIAGTVSYNEANKTATFTPTQLIASNVTFVATVSADVKDTEGNKMGSFYTWSYTTTSEPSGQHWEVAGAELTDEKACELVTDSDANGNIYVAYVLDSTKKLRVLKYDGTSWTLLGSDIYAVSASDKISNIYLKCDNASLGIPHVSFREDSSDGNPRGAYAMVYQSGSFHNYWSSFESSVLTKSTNIGFDNNNILYVGYVGGSDSYPCVKKSAGTGSWTIYPYSGATADAVSMALNSSGVPHLAFNDKTQNRGDVISYGTSWTSLGAPFSDHPANNITLKINGVTVYVSYIDTLTNNLTVAKNVGTSWVYLGGIGIDTSVTEPKLFLVNDIPYIAYRNSSGYIKLQTYDSDSNSWSLFGGITQITKCEDTPIGGGSVTRSGQTIPFLAFSDSGHGGKVTVLEYR